MVVVPGGGGSGGGGGGGGGGLHASLPQLSTETNVHKNLCYAHAQRT